MRLTSSVLAALTQVPLLLPLDGSSERRRTQSPARLELQGLYQIDPKSIHFHMNPQLLNHIAQNQQDGKQTTTQTGSDPFAWSFCNRLWLHASGAASTALFAALSVFIICVSFPVQSDLPNLGTLLAMTTVFASGFLVGAQSRQCVRIPKYVASIVNRRRERTSIEFQSQLARLLGSVGAPPLSVSRASVRLSQRQWELLLKYTQSQVDLIQAVKQAMDTLRLGTSLLFGTSQRHSVERVERNVVRQHPTAMALPLLRKRLYHILNQQLQHGSEHEAIPTVITLADIRSQKNAVLSRLSEQINDCFMNQDHSFSERYFRDAIVAASCSADYLSAATVITTEQESAETERIQELLTVVDSLRACILALVQDSFSPLSKANNSWWQRITELTDLLQLTVNKLDVELKPVASTVSCSNQERPDKIETNGGDDLVLQEIGTGEDSMENANAGGLPSNAVLDSKLNSDNAQKTLVYSALSVAANRKKRRFERRIESVKSEMPKMDVIKELQIRLKALPPAEEIQMNPEVANITGVDSKEQDEPERERAQIRSDSNSAMTSALVQELRQSLKGMLPDVNDDAMYCATSQT